MEWCHVMGVPNQSLNLEWNTKNPDLGSVLHQKNAILEHANHKFWNTKATNSGAPKTPFLEHRDLISGISKPEQDFLNHKCSFLSFSQAWPVGWPNPHQAQAEAVAKRLDRKRASPFGSATDGLPTKVRCLWWWRYKLTSLTLLCLLCYHQITIRLPSGWQMLPTFAACSVVSCAWNVQCAWSVRPVLPFGWFVLWAEGVRRKRNKPIFDCSHHCACEETSMFIINFSWENLWT